MPLLRSLRERSWLGHALWVSLVVTALAALSPSPLPLVDLQIYDTIIGDGSGDGTSDRVALVVVDDRSLREHGQWPWPHDVLADLVEGVRSMGAAVIALDVLLAEPERARDPTRGDDSRLVDAVRHGDVVLGYAFTFDAGSARPNCGLHPLDAAVIQRPQDDDLLQALFRPSGVVCSLPDLTAGATSSGYLNVGRDFDGALRRLPLVMTFEGALYPSLALAAVRLATHDDPLAMRAGRLAAIGLAMDDREIGLDHQGAMQLRFRGRGRTFPHLSAADVLAGRLSRTALQNRIAFVGATALGVRDAVTTPPDTLYPGIEVHATVADNLLRGDAIITPIFARALDIAGAGLVGLLAAILLGRAPSQQGLMGVFVMVACVWAGAWLLARVGSVYLSPLFPTLAAAIAVVAVTVVSLRHERHRATTERHRRQQAYELIVQSLTSMTETRDVTTGLHARRTQAYARLLARRLAQSPRFSHRLPDDTVEAVALLAALHDIGKVGVRDEVLNKRGVLSPDEVDEMRLHPLFGYQTIAKAESRVGVASSDDLALLNVAKDIVYTHHERWDGHGYPRGLSGDAIPLPGRIVAVVDVYDALVEPRPYRAPLSHQEAVTLITGGRGSQFDPDVVDAFLDVERQLGSLSRRFRSEALALGMS
jgi:adenylate cyclase